MRLRALAPTSVPAIAAVLAIALGAPPAAAQIIPDAVPDVTPALADIVDRGSLQTVELPAVAPAPKVVDGDISDWVGTSAMIAGTSHFDAGELIHTDYVWDAHGADAGEDIDRWRAFAGLLHSERRTDRLDDLLRTLDMQLGVPYPVGADEMYGNANGDLSVGDIVEVRLAADEDTAYLLVRTNTMIDPHDTGLVILADHTDEFFDAGQPAEHRLGIPEPTRFDHYITVNAGEVYGTSSHVEYAVNADGYTNAIEVAMPIHFLTGLAGGTTDFTVIAGGTDDDGDFVPHNVAFRETEPVDIYTDQRQAFALHGDAPDGSHLDEFSSGPIDIDDLRGGRTQQAVPGPGYHERHFLSGQNISREAGRDGIRQPYGLYVPTDFDPAAITPATFWLHYRGGKAHSGATINPRLIHTLAREDLWGADAPADTPIGVGQGNLVITPHARGTSYWYVSQSHQDFFEVFADVHDLMPNIDPQRRYLAGYSMGGYGTYLFGLLYPDLFAAGFPVSGAVTQGAWTGIHDSPLCEVREPFSGDEVSPCYIEANSGDASAQLTYRILDNARHLPLHIDHGTDDELVPVSGVQRMAARLVELGYRVEMQTFAGYEHFSQAAVDEWADGAAYLQRFTAPENPRHVTYRVVPALIEALNTIRVHGWQETQRFDFNPDGAYWVDDIEVRDADPHDDTVSGLVDVIATGIDEPAPLSVPVAGGPMSIGHSTPFTRHGLDWLDAPIGPTLAPGFEATLTGVASVTLDGERMQLDPGAGGVACGTATVDGDTALTITGLSTVDRFTAVTSEAGTGHLVSGTVSGDRLTLDLDEGAGTWTIALFSGDADITICSS